MNNLFILVLTWGICSPPTDQLSAFPVDCLLLSGMNVRMIRLRFNLLLVVLVIIELRRVSKWFVDVFPSCPLILVDPRTLFDLVRGVICNLRLVERTLGLFEQIILVLNKVLKVRVINVKDCVNSGTQFRRAGNPMLETMFFICYLVSYGHKLASLNWLGFDWFGDIDLFLNWVPYCFIWVYKLFQ